MIVNKKESLGSGSLSKKVKDIRLFGSVAKGTDTTESDIDILILVESDDRRIVISPTV
ncbi:nucleotidyltransferase domain-containing protein [Desulfosporosinus orientis]|uniref:nucleotidyltransferase domain-containing protein n=1 Tax=Desulfosporosinus orientis TaxID=1563 RepID=UPI0011D2AE0C|nr:nucleotidyltransferase domain-containing protein [Desulfosporosinus orientis]